jgi:hypothetical protein
MKGPWPTAVVEMPVAEAYVNHGRWMVDCPWGCRSAQHASKSDHRFFCVECDSGATKAWCHVTWPSDLEVAAIEAALGLRPDVTKRNWLTPAMRAEYGLDPETAADLSRENKDAGL